MEVLEKPVVGGPDQYYAQAYLSVEHQVSSSSPCIPVIISITVSSSVIYHRIGFAHAQLLFTVHRFDFVHMNCEL